MVQDPTRRFDDRVEAYTRHRPDYPRALLDHLAERAGLAPGAVVADVGSGTGIFSRMLLERGCRVFAVEPNREMREAAERELAGRPGWNSVDGTAEATTLADACADFVTAAQAFHWFRPHEARREFVRILRPPRRVALIWNRRRTAGGFLSGYEKLLLRYGTDYAQVDHRRHSTPQRMRGWFAAGSYEMATFDHAQRLDRDGLCGRVLSSSYAPAAGPDHAALMRELRSLFEDRAVDGAVRIEYDCELHLGRVN